MTLLAEVLQEQAADLSLVELREQMAALAMGEYDTGVRPPWVEPSVWDRAVQDLDGRRLRRLLWGVMLEAELKKVGRVQDREG